PVDQFPDALFENPGFDNRWVTLKLVGTASNRSAIGARIRIEVATASGPRTIYKHVNSGGSFGANPLQQTIGLGQ
ncbi:MAG: CRTAC1 family protein, partial [Actinobacteria bacterium]|nr:CRTAC1 family protein [Actinomycetota bacterium]NIU69731.1 CRTAC1 family protein [Actinomycetota bacterium]